VIRSWLEAAPPAAGGRRRRRFWDLPAQGYRAQTASSCAFRKRVIEAASALRGEPVVTALAQRPLCARAS